MTIQEAVSVGLSTSVVGLAIVFAVLLILMIVLKAFEKIFYKPQKEAKQSEVIKQVNEAVDNGDEEDSDELIAILTAAVAASLNTSTYNLKIKSYRRLDNNSTPWSKAGIRDTIYSRYN